MDATTLDILVQTISTVGFPIVCVLLLFWFIYDTNKQHREEVTQLHTQHNDETGKLAEAINNNTQVMTKLVCMLEGGKTHDL